jgi:hypothetical protein
MEVQSEKKRRRDNEKEKEDDSIVIQHFLTAARPAGTNDYP